MSDIVIQLLAHILAALLYGALGIHFWNTRWREHEGQSIACPMRPWERHADPQPLGEVQTGGPGGNGIGR